MTNTQALMFNLTMLAMRVNWHIVGLIGVGVVAFTYFVSMTATDITWVNVASDAPDYLIATKFWRIAHPTGEPLYLILGGLWLRVFPFGAEYWRLALLSAIPAAATAILLYHHTRNLLAPIVWMASAIVVSQATVAEIYGLTVCLMVLGWHLHQTGHKALAYVALGLGCGVHHWAAIMLAAVFAWDWAASLKTKAPSVRYLLLAIAVGAPWYLYIVLANREPYFSIGGNSPMDYMSYLFSQGGLFGGLSVLLGQPVRVSPDFLMRFGDFARVVGAGFGIPALILLAGGSYYAWRRSGADRMLVILAGAFLCHYFWNADPHTHTYTMPAFAFGGILIAQAKLPRWNLALKGAALLTGVGLMVFNAYYYDIQGPKLDSQAAAVDYYRQLDALPEGAVLWSGGRDWEYTTALLYGMAEHDDYMRIDRIQGVKPSRSLAEVWTVLQEAEWEGRLYESQMVDMAAHTVQIVPAQSARQVLCEITGIYGENRIQTGGFDVEALQCNG